MYEPSLGQGHGVCGAPDSEGERNCNLKCWGGNPYCACSVFGADAGIRRDPESLLGKPRLLLLLFHGKGLHVFIL